MRALFISLAFISASSCFKGWDLGGPWACNAGDVCPEGFSCDEGVCCVPGGTPACPTLPYDNRCPSGREPDVFFFDADRDGDGNEKVARRFCRAPRGGQWVRSAGDCDDTRPDLNSSAPEQCNGLDDNCNNIIDDGLANTTFYRDDDGDLAGDDNAPVAACVAPPGYAAVGGDCEPFDPGKKPGAPELCNNIDDNCNKLSDVSESSFADTDDLTSQRFPCLVPGAVGVCQAGTFRCVSNGVTVRRECTSLQSSSREVCDGLDNNCDGRTDEQAECGGPTNLLGQPGLTYRAQRLPNSTSAQLNGSCQALRAGTPATMLSPDGRVWTGGSVATGGGEYFHVWSVETPANQPWDLSRLDAVLRLAFDATFTPFTGADDGGVWGIAGPTGSGFYPVVYLCGETDDQYIRYRIIATADALDGNRNTFDLPVPLNSAAGTKWLVGTGSGFDTSKVRRIEFVFFTRTSNFTINFRNTTGFAP